MYYVSYDDDYNVVAYTDNKKTAKFYKKARKKSIKKSEDFDPSSGDSDLEIITEYVHTDDMDLLMPMTIKEYESFRFAFDIMYDDLVWIKRLLDMPIKKNYKKSIRRLIDHIEITQGELDTFNLFIHLCE